MRATKHPFVTWVQAFHICSAICNPELIDIRDVLPVTSKAGWALAMRIHEAWEAHLKRESERFGQRRLL